MNFDDPLALDNLCYQMRLADYPRGLNRARINELFNGNPPYSQEEVEENEIEVNVNELSGTVAAHDARSQFYNAFLKPGNFFSATTDSGAKHKRADYSRIVTKDRNRVMKRSIPYVECFRSKFALDVLHGIAPAGWRCRESWCPEPFGVEDVMVPANTLLTLRNLPFVCIYRSITGPELIKMTRGPNVDKGWNLPLVQACIKWIDEQTMRLMGTNWPEIWSPEKQAERVKSDGGFYVGDQVPTIDCWDIYFWNDEQKVSGWNRRMILDAWSQPAVDGSIATKYEPKRRNGAPYGKDHKNQFLYNPGKRKWGDQLSEIITWQFADLSAVAPFRYHSVRSLGLLLYAVCHLQNRLYCKFTEAQFEQMMMYFRVKNSDEMQRALKVDLVHRGFIDDSVQFIPANERYQIRADLVQLGLATNQNIIGRNSASYTSHPQNTQDQRELTATQWMGEANKVTALVSSALNQAYLYQNQEYREIWRRFSIKNSSDPEVRASNARCMRQGVPDTVLFNPDCWELEPERVMGAGNKTLEMAIADRLMAARNLFDPEPQRRILRDFTLAVTDDPARADSLVPDQPQVTDTMFAASLAASALLQRIPVPMKSGINHIDYVDTLMAAMASKIKEIMERDNMGTVPELLGLQNLSQHIGEHVALIAQDPNEKQRVKQTQDEMGRLMNIVKAFAQRLEEQQQAQGQNQGNGQDAELASKLQADKVIADAKAANLRESHGQRTAQKQVQFEMEATRKQQQDQLDLQTEALRKSLELSHQQSMAQIELEKERAKLAEKSAQKAEPSAE